MIRKTSLLIASLIVGAILLQGCASNDEVSSECGYSVNEVNNPVHASKGSVVVENKYGEEFELKYTAEVNAFNGGSDLCISYTKNGNITEIKEEETGDD